MFFHRGTLQLRYTVDMRYVLAGFTLIFLTSYAAPAFAATVYLEPDVGTYGPGDTFIVNVRLDTGGECVNAANVELRYPASKLRATDFSKGSSVFSLWIGDPVLDTENGTVRFQGGVPGGYCGRIQGDPALSNVLGKVIFTALAESGEAAIEVTPQTALYLNDGAGTEVQPEKLLGTAITLAAERTTAQDPWLAQVHADMTPPDPFEIIVESTRGVFSGKYFIVFSTVDKQSGMDHYEIFERGAWRSVTSPHELKDQSLKGGIRVKAIDKAGNERHGTYTEGSAPPRQYEPKDTLISFVIAGILFAIVLYELYRRRKKHLEAQAADAEAAVAESIPSGPQEGA